MNSSRPSSLSNKHRLGDMLDLLDSFRHKVESPLNIARLTSTTNFYNTLADESHAKKVLRLKQKKQRCICRFRDLANQPLPGLTLEVTRLAPFWEAIPPIKVE